MSWSILIVKKKTLAFIIIVIFAFLNINWKSGVTTAIAETNQLPVLNPVGDQSVTEGQTLTFTVTAADPDGTTPVLSATNLPGTASFVDNSDGTGTFSWTPAAGDAGTYADVSFTATDALDSGLFDSETIAITVTSGSLTGLSEIPPTSLDLRRGGHRLGSLGTERSFQLQSQSWGNAADQRLHTAWKQRSSAVLRCPCDLFLE